MRWAIVGSIIAGILLGFFIARPAIAQAPLPDVSSTTTAPPVVVAPVAEPKPIKPISIKKTISTGHGTRADKQVEPTVLVEYLTSQGSPLAAEAVQLSKSPYWSTIIGICTIEQYNCTRAPYNNYWGIMKPGGGLQHYATLADGITAVDNFLNKAYNSGHDTIEKLNGWYVVPASTNWFNTVLNTKLKLENL